VIEWLIELFNIKTYGSVTVTALATCILAIVTFGTMIAIISVGWFQLRRLRREAHKREVGQLLSSWTSPEMMEARQIVGNVITAGNYNLIEADAKEFAKQKSYLKDEMLKLQKVADIRFFQIVGILDYLESLGYMMKSKDAKQKVKDLLGDNIICYYERFKLWIEEIRVQYPRTYIYLEELYNYCCEKT